MQRGRYSFHKHLLLGLMEQLNCYFSPQELDFQVISLWTFRLLRPHFTCCDHIPFFPLRVCIKKSTPRTKPSKSPLKAAVSRHWVLEPSRLSHLVCG